jgi:hypothetical protein
VVVATILVTLVHGTFAREAEWTELNSSFATELKRQLTPEIKMTRWQWSGKNDFFDRNLASEQFKNYLLSVRKGSDKGVPHYIIAHSHGGNVVLDAMRAVESKGMSENLIFLGTPFFHFRGRKNKELNGLLKMACMITSLIAAAFAAAFVAAVFSRFGIAPLIFGIASFLCAITVIVLLSKYLHRKIVIPITRRAIRNKRKISDHLNKLDSNNIFVSYVIGDEAYLLLKVLSIAHWAVICAFFFPAMGLVIWLMINLGIEGALRRAFVYGSVGSAAAAVLAEAVSLIGDRILIRHSKAFGKGSWLDAFSMEVDVSRVPPNTRTPEINSIPFAKSLIHRNRYLRHSIFYKDDNTIVRIAKWINLKCGGQAP